MSPYAFLDNHATQGFSCLTAWCGRYAAETYDGILYLVGKEQKEEKKVITNEKIGLTNILNTLLRLYERLSDDLYGHVVERITEKDIELIAEWSVRYGMPMESGELWEKHSRIGFRLDTFYNRLHKLYNCYLLWRVLYLGDISEKNFYVSNKITINQCRTSLQANMALLNIRMMPVFDTDPPTYQLVCPDLLEIAMAQMFFECMNTDGYNIGVCTVCGSPFPKTRKNNTLCEECQRTKYQRTRDKQRMVANIKKKSERTD